jgi:WD40 repeat protein
MRFWYFAVLLVGLIAAPCAGNAQSRVALVIGNSTYQNVSALPNPVNDANDISESLKRLGFDVKTLTNATFDDMRRALIGFGQQARSAEFAVVFFAGHGMEIGGENWLIPVDAQLTTDLDVANETIGLQSLTRAVSNATRLGLVILDACRSNPFLPRMQRTNLTRAVDRGFTRVEPNDNVLVAYSARDGTTANDGSGRNSPFTGSLLKNIETPGLEITFLFRIVRDEVMTATKREQQPFIYGSLSRDFVYFKPPAAASEPSVHEPVLPPVAIVSPLTPPALAKPDKLDEPSRAVPQGVLVREFKGNSGPVTSAVFSPDGQQVLTGGYDGRLRIWNAASGAQLREISGPSGLVTAVGFSPNGRLIFSGSDNGGVRLWNAESGTLVRDINGHSTRTVAVAFSPSGSRILAANENHRVQLWNASSGTLIREYKIANSSLIFAVAFSPDGTRVLLGGYGLYLLNADSGALINAYGTEFGTETFSVAFSPDGQRIVSGGRQTAQLWDVASGTMIRGYRINSPVNSLAYSPDGQLILSGSRDGNVQLWDSSSGALVREFRGYSGAVSSVAFSPDGKLVLSGSGDNSARLWDASAGSQMTKDTASSPR